MLVCSEVLVPTCYWDEHEVFTGPLFPLDGFVVCRSRVGRRVLRRILGLDKFQSYVRYCVSASSDATLVANEDLLLRFSRGHRGLMGSFDEHLTSPLWLVR